MVDTMEQDKLKTLLRLRYHNSTQDTVADLGSDVGKSFAGFQRYLYQDAGRAYHRSIWPPISRGRRTARATSSR